MTATITVDDTVENPDPHGASGVAHSAHSDAPEEQLNDHSALSEDGAIDPTRVRLFRGPRGVLRCTVEGEKSVLRAKVVRAFPVSERSRWINVLDGKNKEVCLIEDPSQLDFESARLVAEELERFYRISDVLQIYSIKQEYRTLFWDVETERGRRDFVVKWSSDTVFWRDTNELLLVDIDTNRFRIPNVTRLDPQSQKQLNAIL